MRFMLAVLAFLILRIDTAGAQMITAMTATLAPVTSVPAADMDVLGPPDATTTSKGSGTATFTVDRSTKQLRWQVSYVGLSSEPVGAHIHTDAGPGVSPTQIVDLGQSGLGNPIVGSMTLDDAQLAELVAGRTFVDIHTKFNEDGEISGKISP